MKKLKQLSLILFSLSLPLSGYSQMTAQKSSIIAGLEEQSSHYGQIAHKIWELAELGFLEKESVKILSAELEGAGFKVTHGVAGMPTAFVAEWGSDGPVIGMLAEFDALPGMSQQPNPEKIAREEGKPGHACGHHMYGTASVAAAIAVKNALAASGKKGTIRLYGTPAEEGGGGKIFMVRAGLFDDVDAVLTWHPGDVNVSNPSSTLAAISATFTFSGISSHAARAPERGRSALDGVEAMNSMVNLLREHIPMESRIHYSIKFGGGAPNVVPATATAAYVIRHPDMRTLKDLVRRVNLAAEGAAMGTETTVEMKIETGYFNILPNTVLSKLVHDNLSLVGGIKYSEEETAFAHKIMESFQKIVKQPESANEVVAYNPIPTVVSASTDVGDISWVVPTSSMRAATWVPGTMSHSWQAVAAGGMSIGEKGMMIPAKTLSLAAMDLYNNPALLMKAKSELLERRGPDFKYEALLGDIDPPLGYRVNY